ncbi:MAG: hypothetical protein JWN18_198 [Parcubacteria group bacterium]|nr:hypothetical protein [Parcubacteria group bacterium]
MTFDRRETAILLIGDFLILAASLWVALLLRNLAIPGIGYFQSNLVPFLPMFLLSLGVFYIAGLYEKLTRPIRRVMGVRVAGAQGATVAIAAILFFILPLSIAPKTILILYLVVSVLAETAWRFYRMNYEIKTESRTPAVLIGSGGAVLELFEEVRENNRYLMHFARMIDTRTVTEETLVTEIGSAFESGIRVIVIDAHDPVVARIASQLYDLTMTGFTVVEFASLYEEIFDRVPLDHVDAPSVLNAVSNDRALYDLAKRIFDFTLAALVSLVAIPFVAIAALVLFVDGGTPFIHSERIGRGNQKIRLVKLRTMLFFDAGDPEKQKQNRVTSFGSLLRKTRIDELPQLWNVLKGELSFIGPRPELPMIAAVYEKEIPHYRLRHLIAPGLSGWAQIHDYDAPRGGADVPRTRRKLSFDLYYLKHRSFGVDLTIAAKSVRAILSLSGT